MYVDIMTCVVGDATSPAQHFTGHHWRNGRATKRGRPKNTWRRTVEGELKTYNQTWGTNQKLRPRTDRSGTPLLLPNMPAGITGMSECVIHRGGARLIREIILNSLTSSFVPYMLRTFGLIVSAHPYCARKSTCHAMPRHASSACAKC